MFTSFKQWFSADVQSLSDHAGKVEPEQVALPRALSYRLSLITGLRAEHNALLRRLDEILGSQSESPGTIEKQLESFRAAFRQFQNREISLLYPFLEHHAGIYGTHDAAAIRSSRHELWAFARELSGQIDRYTQRPLQAHERHWFEKDMARLRERLQGLLRDKQHWLYPLYHQYGIQRMRLN